MWPDNNKEILLLYFFFCPGAFAMHVGVSFGKNSLLISFLAFWSSLIHWFTSSSLISIWLTKFIAKCKEALIVSSSDTNKLVGKVKDILSIYTNSDQTFFTIFQLTWIIVLYLGVSAYFSKYEPQFTLLFGVGPLFSPFVDQGHVLHHGGRLPGCQGPGDALECQRERLGHAVQDITGLK